jgi:quercetin dioxygenase-like cupin family protein
VVAPHGEARLGAGWFYHLTATPKEATMTTSTESTAYILAAGEGEPMSWFDARFNLKASTPSIGIHEFVIPVGNEPPLHVHSREDEWFYVLEGEVTFHAGDQNLPGSPGSLVSLPRGIPHTFTVESGTARMLMLNAPGGFERMFDLAPTTVPAAVEALNRYGIQVAGPHPREAAAQG